MGYFLHGRPISAEPRVVVSAPELVQVLVMSPIGWIVARHAGPEYAIPLPLCADGPWFAVVCFSPLGVKQVLFLVLLLAQLRVWVQVSILGPARAFLQTKILAMKTLGWVQALPSEEVGQLGCPSSLLPAY